MPEALKPLLDEIYGTDSHQLYYEITCQDERDYTEEHECNIGERDFALAEAAYWFCVHYHGGQDSQLYSWQCRLNDKGMFRPGVFDNGEFDEETEERWLYDYLVDHLQDQ